MLELPWPSQPLWQNRRCHWSERHRATKQARKTAYYLMWEAGLRFPAKASFRFTFRAPSLRRYDEMNCLAACKAFVDGMSDASGVDDEHWHIEPIKGEIKRPGGCVEVRLVEDAYPSGKSPRLHHGLLWQYAALGETK